MSLGSFLGALCGGLVMFVIAIIATKIMYK